MQVQVQCVVCSVRCAERDENVVAKILLIEIALTKRKERLARKKFQKAKRDADKARPAGWMQKSPFVF